MQFGLGTDTPVQDDYNGDSKVNIDSGSVTLPSPSEDSVNGLFGTTQIRTASGRNHEDKKVNSPFRRSGKDSKEKSKIVIYCQSFVKI